MRSNLMLAAALPAAPERLFEMYVDEALHTAFTGAPAKIEAVGGGSFSAFNGVLSGRMLHLEPKRMIVQTWRSSNWPAGSIDSILVLTFWPEAAGGRIELVQVNVPEEDFAGVSQGWEKYYWGPWRAYLEGRG